MLLFRRDYQGFSGGNLKVWHYFRHASQSRRFVPRIYLTPCSLIDETCPWQGVEPPPLTRWRPEDAAALFVAGLDWEAIPEDCRVPVVNLVQGLRHADPADPRFAFLSRPAVRICVSEEVAGAIIATGHVNGPIHVIPGAVDLAELPAPAEVRDIPILIAGSKRPALARAVSNRLRAAGVAVECRDSVLPRREFLDLIARAEVAVFLPFEREGLFMPALEAMAMGTLVVCPDCVGNRSFCRNDVTALIPTHSADAIARAAIEAKALAPARRRAMVRAAGEAAKGSRIDSERRAFLNILDALPSGTSCS